MRLFPRIGSISKSSLLLLAIALVAAGLRLYSISHGVTFHPDERHIVMVTERLSLQDPNPHSFAYGSFPFYFSWAVSEALGLIWPSLAHYDGLFLVGRCLAALFGVLGVLLTYTLAQVVFNRRAVSILAASFTALNVFHLQLSRFFAVDIFLTTWCLIALLAAAKLATSGGWKNYALAGISFGFALATKISALALLAPLSIAVLAQARRDSKFLAPKQIAMGLGALLLGLLVCFLVQPYSILDFEAFKHDTIEQTNMVRGLWRPPYTIQYEGTLPYLYPLVQMWSYTMGPPLALAVFAGVLFLALRQVKFTRYGELVVLAWVIPDFLAFAGLNVKFPRYFLPLYPALFVSAAFVLAEVARWLGNTRLRKLRNLPAIIVLGWTAFYAVAWERIYSVDHGYQLATRWIFQNIPEGSGILGVDWDDKVPLFLPGLDPRHYFYEGRPWELPLYGKDSTEKLDELVAKLTRANYIAFPTARTYGSIPRIPQEYPLTTNFLRMLFAGKLGYSLEQTIKVRPQFAGIVFDDDLADESLSVYDHPKVSIFKKVESLAPSELRRRILEPFEFTPLPTMEQMMRMNAGSADLPVSSVQNSLSTLVLWLLVIEFLGIVAFPLLTCALPRAPDFGFGMAKQFGLLMLGAILWIFTSLGLLRTSTTTAWVTLAVVAAFAAGTAWRLRLSTRVHHRRREILTAEILFLAGYLGFCLLRAFQPEINWGEKPMDFSFLNYFIRLETLPPQDPWAAGHFMHYYYFGTYLFALLHKLGGFDSAVGYNLSIATIAGFALSTGYSLCLMLTRRWLPAVLGAAGVVLLSNLEVVRLIFWGDKRSFDLFWASTRLFKEPGITEYPLWALLFADLHAHLIAFPIALLLLALSLRFLHHERSALDTSIVLHRLFCGMALGTLYITNTWDFISYGFTLGCIIFLACALNLSGRRQTAFQRCSVVVGDLLRDLPLLALGALPFVLLFNRASGSQTSPGFGFNQYFEFDTAWQVLRHLGQWIALIVIGIPALMLNNPSKRHLRVGRRTGCAIFWGSIPLLVGLSTAVLRAPHLAYTEEHPILLGLDSVITLLRSYVPLPQLPAPGLEQLPWDILALCSALCSLAGFMVSGNRISRQIRVACVFTIAASCIIAGAEILFLIDHMNTIFKFYNAVWVLLALAAMLIFPRAVPLLWTRLPRVWAWTVGRPVCLLLTAILAIACAGSLFNFYSMTTFQRVMGPRPVLDGMAYLFWADAQEAAALQWLRKNIPGVPTILEAQGPSYGQFTRVSMNTGLPTVLGWEWHVRQRGLPEQAAREREDVIKAIYSAPDPETAIDYCKLLGVDLVIVGSLERQLYANGTYNRLGLKKWDEHHDVFRPLFRSGSTVIYKLPFSKLP